MSLFPLAPIVDQLIVSPTIEINDKVKELKAQNETVWNASIGEPTNSPPKEVIDALTEAAQKGLTKYTAVAGEKDLREAICKDLKTRKGIDCAPDQIVVSNGAKQSVYQSLLAVVKPGSAVVVPAPHWSTYLDMVRMCGAAPISVATHREDGYNIRPEKLEELLASTTVSCLILCNPNNPSGSVPTKEQLEGLATVLKKFPNVAIISDEIYERILFDGAVHTSFATIRGMEHRTIVVNGPSKAFSMTGFRIGYSMAPLHIAKAIANLQSQITNCSSSLAQYATLATYGEGLDKWLDASIAELKRKRDLTLDLLNSNDKLHLHFNIPQGTFYLFLDVSYYLGKKHTTTSGDAVVIDSSVTLCRELLASQRVALVPGLAFGMDDHIRLHFAASEEILRKVVDGLTQFLTGIKSN